MLPTQKLYQTVDRTQYDGIKQRYVNALSPTYGQLANREKWQVLMEIFIPLMPEHAQELRNFCRQRLDTPVRAGNISLADCISYFEQFYFLYTTREPLFKLNDAEKMDLKALLLDGMGYACEPGKQERFELALALYRRDTNWINGHLSQARYHVLEGLAERCNVALQIGDGYSPHTIKLMKELADAKQLGIDSETALTDVYGVDRGRITTYFTSYYRAAFHEYESHAADDLSQQLLNEFTDFLREKVNMVSWEREGIIIPLAHMDAFNRFFESKSFDAVMDDLRDDSDEDNLKLKNKADFITGIRALVNKKLLQNGYYVSMENLHALPSQGMPALPTWHGGCQMQELVAVAQFIENRASDLPARLNQHASVLLQYPRLVLDRIARSPAILITLPPVYRANKAFIDDVFTVVNDALLTAMDARDPEKIERLIESLLAFLPNTHGDFSKLSERVLNHPTVALALVKRDGLLLRMLSTPLKNDRRILEVAIAQNGLALSFATRVLQNNPEFSRMGLEQLRLKFGAFGQIDSVNLTAYQACVVQIYKRCKNALPRFAQHAFQQDWTGAFTSGHPDLIYAGLKAIEKMDALHELYGAGSVSALKLASLAQQVTPAELLGIVQYRRQQNLSPLPYCDHLEAFHQDLTNAEIVWAADGYWAAKRQAQAVPGIDTPLHESSAVGHLARTHHWYMALVKYNNNHQLTFQTWAQFFELIQNTIRALLQSIGSMLKLAVTFLGFMGLAIIPAGLSSVIGGGILGVILGEIALYLPLWLAIIAGFLTAFLVVVAVAFILAVMNAYVEEYFLPPLMGFFIAESNQLCDAVQAMANNVYALMVGIYAIVFSPAEPQVMDTLAARCERSIERLLFTKEDASANQKGALLATLWDKIQAEGPWDSDATLQRRLNKKYDVTYQGQTRQVSFSEVASTKRLHAERFNLDEPKSVYGFFAQVRATTTDSMLDQRPEMQQAA